jgi:hypothetical protein
MQPSPAHNRRRAALVAALPTTLATAETVMNGLVPVDLAAASLPTNYAAACVALAECAHIDECQDWADKMAALASYALQAENKELAAYCRRIHARAVRRCGELLKEIEPDKGGRPKTQERTLPSFTRAGAAAAAGLSEHQRKTSLRIANVPADEFEEAVESATPPTVTALAVQGRQPRSTDTRGRRPTSKPPTAAAPAALDRDTAIVGFARVLHSKLAETLDDLVRILADERDRITALPRDKRVAIARGYVSALGLRISDLQPIVNEPGRPARGHDADAQPVCG